MKLYSWLLVAVLFYLPLTLSAQTDCPDAIMVCGDANYNGLDATGIGTQEINFNNACSSMENNSLWLKILIKDGGTLGFVLTPESSNLSVDFDFWIFGPDVACGNLGTAVRCSTTNPLQAALLYNTTGMNAVSTDVSEGPGPDGNAFINWMNVQDGESYYIIIDRPVGSSNFSMEWTGTATFHDVPVFLNPDNIPTDLELCDSDDIDDESTVFNLTTHAEMFIGNQTPVEITYHLSVNDMITGESPISSPEVFENTSNPQVIYMRMTNTITGCYSNETFTLSIIPPIVGGEPNDLVECDVNGDGFALFNLVANDTPIKDGNTQCSVTYYASQANAIAETDPLPEQYQNTIAYGPQTIWSRLEKTNGCIGYDLRSFTLTVLPLPQFLNPNNQNINLSHCDDDDVDDQSVAFNLTTHQAMFTGGQANLEVDYYTNPDFTGQINNPLAYANTSNPQTIYATLTNNQTDCSNSIEFTIEVTNPVTAGIPQDLFLCDSNGNGSEFFYLNENDAAIKNGNPTSVVAYYASLENAEDEVGALSIPHQNPSTGTPQTIWARLESTDGCFGYAITSFTINLSPPPVFNNPDNIPLEIKRCDDDGVEDQHTNFDLTIYNSMFAGNQQDAIFSFFESYANAVNGINIINDPTWYTNLSMPQTVYVKITNALTGCFNIASIQLQLVAPPVAFDVLALQECDFNNDGVAYFNLDAVIDNISATLGSGVIVTIHETQPDADFGTNIIPNTAQYSNVFNNAQTLYIRVQSEFGNCFDTTTLQLIVNPVPEATTPTFPYALCDNGDSDVDGIAVFDLTSLNAEVLNGMDAALFSVTYHLTHDDAVAGANAITTPANYATINTIIYIRVTNNATGCYDVVQVQLVVNALPVVTQPAPYTVCDDDNPGDEIEEFDLTTKIDEIIGVGTLGLNVSFHPTYADAQGNTNAIVGAESYFNTLAVETIFVRVADAITDCYRIVLLDVRVEPLPEILEPLPIDLTVCDTNGEGIGVINLDELVEDMINGGENLVISFHWTDEDAQNNLNAISNTSSLQNMTPFLQAIYVRVFNTATGCFNTYKIEIIVTAAPQAPALENIVDCDDYDNNVQDGKARVDLTVQNQVIYDALNIAAGDQDSIIIHYFISEEDADADINMITNATQYTATNGQVIWVRVEDAETGCYSLTSFQVILNKPVDLIQPTPLVLCEDGTPNDGKTIFDLTVKNTEILGPMGIGMGNVVTYYTTQADALAGTNAIPDPEAYTNTSNAQTLFVEVTTPAGCKSYITLTIRVLPLPVPNMNPTALEKCDDISADGTETFNLTDAAAQILANDTLSQLSYWLTEEDANNGTNEILTPTAWPSATGSVWVKVSAQTTNATDPVCYVLVELNLIVNPLPATGTIAPYAICQLVYTGTATFDFNTHIDEILGAGVAPEDYDDYTLTFYFDAAAQAANTPLPYIYDNVSTPQTILVEVVNTVTGCTNTASFVIAVEQQAIANPVTQATLDTYFDLCDTDGSNDGFTEFDLTQATADIIGTQSPAANYTVTYYETQADALAGTNAIPTPAAYTNTTQNEQTIVAAISDITTVSGCISYTTFTVKAEILAEPVISTPGDDHTICVDFKTGQTVKGLTLNSGITTAGNTYKWFLDGVEVTLDPSASTYEAVEAGNYTVEVTGPAPNFCVSGVSAAFNVIQSGTAVKIGEGYVVSNAFSDSQTITVLVEGYGQYQYSLDGGPWQNSNVFTNVSLGVHEVVVRDVQSGQFSCDSLTISNVSTIGYPHFFSPNGDTEHETWNVIGLKDHTIFIFDRYGKLVKQISSDGKGWDGSYNGKPLPATDYWFTLALKEGRIIKGHFSLLR
ncbi:T9SS type B sorting domain-containing protein [Flavobacterium subsaxonicum]|uniref:T9SS type B sorting domain-containing protein n=1 Tax=Flavobacterium subsaxonicum TaxID=426226 RepID=UPI000401C4CD|nr:T9SS type B sorting domain-containing protein [Flavobacterium subsaxonicum]